MSSCLVSRVNQYRPEGDINRFTFELPPHTEFDEITLMIICTSGNNTSYYLPEEIWFLIDSYIAFTNNLIRRQYAWTIPVPRLLTDVSINSYYGDIFSRCYMCDEDKCIHKENDYQGLKVHSNRINEEYCFICEECFKNRCYRCGDDEYYCTCYEEQDTCFYCSCEPRYCRCD